jgi:HEPN domain-containing protein
MVAHLRTSLVLFVPLADARLYEPKEPVFGPNFENKFRSASYDLEEAAKCLALGRDTACAFHLVRIVEVALRAVHACLGINVALVGNDRNRGTILGRIRDDLKNRGNKWPEKATFDEIYALLDSVKGRWRDATMHVEEKYTPQEAQRLFQTIHNFMERLSARMDENGEPKV